MNTITIQIRESIDKTAAGKTIVGFEVSQKIDVNGGEDKLSDYSFVPILTAVLPRIILTAINELQHRTGGHCHEIGMKPKSFSIDEAMADLKNELEANEDSPEKYIN
ncbi:MAG: hypothetical protein J2P41_15975 [Blastocatellia bacterium]|nr:hypothetical protein [Blastocatellia bacterium]